MRASAQYKVSEHGYANWMRLEARRMTEGAEAVAEGQFRWVECPLLGIEAMCVNLKFRKAMLLSQDVPAGQYLSLVGHCDFEPVDDLQWSLRENFKHSIAAVELNQSVPDPVQFSAGGRLQMVRLRLTQASTNSALMPNGKDQPFKDDSAYQTARILPIPPVLLGLCQQIWQCDWPGQAGDLFVQAKIWEILANLLRTPWQIPGSDRNVRLVARAQALLSSDLGADWTLTQVARHLGTNERYLKQAFRDQLGMGLATWLRQARMETAKRWLDETPWSITRIALQLGYNAAGRFSAAFERHSGMLPSDYRQRSGRDVTAVFCDTQAATLGF